MLARNEEIADIYRITAEKGDIVWDTRTLKRVRPYKPYNDFYGGINPHPSASIERPVITSARADRTALSSVACRVRVLEQRLGALVPFPETPAFRTPAQFRAIYEEWAAKNRKKDYELFGKKIEPSENPRLGKDAEELASLLEWVQLNRIRDPMATNWKAPKQDDEPYDTDDDSDRPPEMSTECKHEMRPTITELLASFSVEETESGPIPTAGGGSGFRGVVGDVVYGPKWKVRQGALKGMVVRPIQRLGSLVFGTEYREGKRGLDRGSVIRFGASATKLGFPPFERYGQPFGPKRGKEVRAQIRSTNDHYADMLGTSPFLYIKGRRLYPSNHEPRDGEHPDDDQYDGNYDGDGDYDDVRSKSKLAPELCGNVPLAEARAWAGLPPAVPAFLGMRATGKPRPIVPREDPFEHLQELGFIRGKLGLGYCRVLDLAIASQGLKYLGAELGISGKQAKSLLFKVTKRFSEILKKRAQNCRWGSM
jgi:hypothetical protein